jgi:hypothetical protein
VDNAAPTGAPHVRDHKAGQTRRRQEEDVKGLLPHLVFVAGGGEMDAVDEDIDPAKATDGGLHKTFGIVGEGQVARDGEDIHVVRLDSRRGAPERVFAARSEDEAATLSGQREGSVATDAARGAGDDRHFTSETQVHGATIEASITRAEAPVILAGFEGLAYNSGTPLFKHCTLISDG